ncbi:LOG family protein YvdD [compost metagenome]
MYDRSDAFACLPGGFGTMDEVMEILTWKQLGIHDKPVVFVNVNGYYDHMRSLFERMIEDGLLKPEYVQLYHFVDDVDGLFAYLEGYTPQKEGVMRWA